MEEVIEAEGQHLLGWRDVPVDSQAIGSLARESEPVIRQVFIGKNAGLKGTADFERKLYVVCKRVEREVESRELDQGESFYIASLSAATVVYKGLLTAPQIPNYYRDLADPAVKSALCLVHSRFSTNTFPSWKLAHPYRYLAHNGEINTLCGNRNWMRARSKTLSSDLFGEDLPKIFPLVSDTGSDSATIDNALQFLVQGGRSLAHSVVMLIPEAWNKDIRMDPDKRGFYEYHSCLMEPWDGPASIAFTDGTRIGAVLDRNGLASFPLCGHQGKPGGDGLRSGRAGNTRGASPVQGPAPTRQDVSGRHRAGPHHRRLGAQGGSHHPKALSAVGRSQPDRAFPVAAGSGGEGTGGRRPADPAAGVRLYRGRPSAIDGSHGQERRRGGRVHGHGYAAGGSLQQVAASLQLLQAALRPGDQPSHRFHPGRDGDVGRELYRQRAESAGRNPQARPPAQIAVPRIDRSRACPNPARLGQRLQRRDLEDAFLRGRRRRRIGDRPGSALPAGFPGGEQGAQHHHSLRSRRRWRKRAHSRPCWQRRRSTTTSFGKAPGPRQASWWKPARLARSCTSRS